MIPGADELQSDCNTKKGLNYHLSLCLRVFFLHFFKDIQCQRFFGGVICETGGEENSKTYLTPPDSSGSGLPIDANLIKGTLFFSFLGAF